MLFLFLGMLLFFDRGLLAIGNVSIQLLYFSTSVDLESENVYCLCVRKLCGSLQISKNGRIWLKFCTLVSWPNTWGVFFFNFTIGPSNSQCSLSTLIVMLAFKPLYFYIKRNTNYRFAVMNPAVKYQSLIY